MARAHVAAVVATLAVFGAALPPEPLATGHPERVVHVTASKFEYSPSEITLERGVPVVLEITSLDRDHGFKVPEIGVRADVKPGQTTRIRLVPDRVGRFEFRCDVFCGAGHEDMAGELVVVE